jgi:hypothetical protein
MHFTTETRRTEKSILLHGSTQMNADENFFVSMPVGQDGQPRGAVHR